MSAEQAAAASTASQTIASNVEFWNSVTVTNNMTGGQTINFNGQISGNGGLTITGVGATVLNAANTYVGGTTLGASRGPAALRATATVTATNALGIGGVTFDPGGNASTAWLELAGNLTLPNNISLAGRNNTSAAIQNVSGNNTLSGTITTNAGGGGYVLQSDAGMLNLTGSTSGATNIGVALQVHSGGGARTLTLQGAGDGAVVGRIQNGGCNVLLAKAGGGTWTAAANNNLIGSLPSPAAISSSPTAAR